MGTIDNRQALRNGKFMVSSRNQEYLQLEVDPA